MSSAEALATLNACFNAAAGALALSGWIAIRRGRRQLHRRLMLAAFVTSCLFLASYLTRMALFGDTRFGGDGALRTAYLSLLASHVLLAIAAVPLILRTLWLALRGRFDPHRRIARVTFPIWIYVSISGVAVYLALYRLA